MIIWQGFPSLPLYVYHKASSIDLSFPFKTFSSSGFQNRIYVDDTQKYFSPSDHTPLLFCVSGCLTSISSFMPNSRKNGKFTHCTGCINYLSLKNFEGILSKPELTKSGAAKHGNQSASRIHFKILTEQSEVLADWLPCTVAPDFVCCSFDTSPPPLCHVRWTAANYKNLRHTMQRGVWHALLALPNSC